MPSRRNVRIDYISVIDSADSFRFRFRNRILFCPDSIFCHAGLTRIDSYNIDDALRRPPPQLNPSPLGTRQDFGFNGARQAPNARNRFDSSVSRLNESESESRNHYLHSLGQSKWPPSDLTATANSPPVPPHLQLQARPHSSATFARRHSPAKTI